MTAELPEDLQARCVEAAADVLHDLDSQFVPPEGWTWWANEIRLAVLPLVADHYETQRRADRTKAQIQSDDLARLTRHRDVWQAIAEDDAEIIDALRAEIAEARATIARVEELVSDYDAPGWVVNASNVRDALRGVQ